ncbi:MBL fold metallo-hydrolase [Niveibacterium sp. SC-1]|uniref:MBL fold metallo-hydrolase n=1 Tax=Niveibacterium sp. SC-1 TaxID=3135646 RepID=UPI00311EB126
MHRDFLSFPFDVTPVAGALARVAPGVRWLRFPLPFALDHINLWLIEEADGYALVDTGYGDATTRDLWEGVLAVLERPLTRIVLTHAHPDHIGNAAWLAQRFGIPVYASLGEYLWAHAMRDNGAGHGATSMANYFRRHGLDAVRADAQETRGNVYARGVPELPRSFLRLIDGDTLELGGRSWEVIAGYGHSAEHLAFYCAQDEVLISGDMLLPRISTNVSAPLNMPQEDAVTRYLTSVARFAALPENTLVLPSHGRPFRGAALRVRQLAAHHEARCGELVAALTQPKSAAELLPVLFPRELDRHQLMFAMGEAIAHLNHLAARGLIRPVADEGDVLRFEKTAALRPLVE